MPDKVIWNLWHGIIVVSASLLEMKIFRKYLGHWEKLLVKTPVIVGMVYLHRISKRRTVFNAEKHESGVNLRGGLTEVL